MSKEYLFRDTFDADAPMRVDSVRIKWETDQGPDLSYLEQDYSDCTPDESKEYRKQDAQRLAAYLAGEWEMRGCVAVAEVSYPLGNGSRRIERFSSGGLWGIESDSDADYLRETEQEQLADLKEHLSKFGVPWPDKVTA